MNCETCRELLPLSLYAELSFEQEELLETHLAACPACRAARDRDRDFQLLLDRHEEEMPAGLLARNRRHLSGALAHVRTAQARPPLWRRLAAAFWNPPGWLKPAGAMAFVALGFVAARWEPPYPGLARALGRDTDAPRVARVRFVSPEGAGRIQVSYDEIRPRTVTGSLQDETVRRLLLAAASDPSDPGARLESIEMLKSQPNDDVRVALLRALQTDRNSGVRLKALEGLKGYLRDSDTRKALCNVLLTDDNPGVRATAVDLLMESQHRQPEVLGVLQELLRREQDNYVRSRSQKMLSEMKASMGTF
jgi:hypothetical protein